MDPFGNEISELLISTYQEINRIEGLVLRSLSSNVLSIAELHILDVVGRKGCTVTDISQRMGVSMPSATIAVKKLEKKGYVTKERDPEDARCVRIRLTALGRKADAAHHWFHRQMMRNIEKAFQPEEKEVLLRAVHELNDFFKGKAQELQKTYENENTLQLENLSRDR